MSLLSNPAGRLAAGRVVIGVAAWAAPKLFLKASAINPDANPAASYPVRLFGVRDVILGLGLLNASGAERRRWLQLGVLTDVVDVAAAGLAAKEGAVPPVAAVLGGGAALGGAVLGVLALRADSADV